MRTISQIISTDSETTVEAAIQAAYWAGQSDMRGKITESIKANLATLPPSRYHHLVRRVAEHVAAAKNINQNHLYGYGDSGRDEAAEFLSWDFDV